MKKNFTRHLSHILAGCTLLLAVTCANAQTTTYTFHDVMYEAYYNLSGIAVDNHLKMASVVYDEYTTFTIVCSTPYCTDPKFCVSCTFVDTNRYESHVISWVCDGTGKRVSYQESVSLFGVPILLIMDEAERASFMTLLEARCTDAILVASGRVVRNPTNTEE